MTSSNPQTSFSKWSFPPRTDAPSLGRLSTGTLLLAALSILLAFLLEGYSGPPLPEYAIGDIARADVLVQQDLVFKGEHASQGGGA